MYVCMFAIGGSAVGPMGLKFCKELALHPGSVLGWVWAGRPPPPGRGWPRSASRGPPSPNRAFPGKLYKTKVADSPWFSWGGSGQEMRRTSSGPRGWPRSASRGPPSPSRSFPGQLYKTKVEERPRFNVSGSGQTRCRTSPGPLG